MVKLQPVPIPNSSNCDLEVGGVGGDDGETDGDDRYMECDLLEIYVLV